MEKEVFELFRNFIYEKSGITLRTGKESLVEGRVCKRLKDLGIGTHLEYFQYLKNDGGEELVQFLDVISTNVTNFFREPEHFVLMDQFLKAWFNEGQKRYRIWCAASSTGEEPYTIALTGQSAFNSTGIDMKILATDISTRVLEKAKKAEYSLDDLKDIPVKFHSPNFMTVSKTERIFTMHPALRAMLTFSRLNLSTPPFPMSGPFDIVFCRNVMIYFDDAVRTRLINDIERLLKPGGILFVGHSESLSGIKTGLKLIRPSVYKKVGTP